MSTLLFKNNLDGTTDVVSGGINTLKINADKTLATTTPSNTMSGNNLATVGQIPSLVVTSISGLLAADTSKVVNVLNYHTGLEGGGGVFYWDASKPKTEHNGGTVIDPAKVFPTDWNNQTQLTDWFTAGSSGTGCWVRQYDGAVNVKWFGAKGDNNTLDNIPMQNAINTLQSVFIPAGSFIVQKPLIISHAYFDLHGLKEKSGIRARADIETITLNGSSGKVVLWIQPLNQGLWNDSGWIEGGNVRDLYINGNSVAEGIRFNRVVNGMVLDSLRIDYCTKGIHGTYSGWCNSYQDLQITNCIEHGILLEYYHNGVVFNGCTIYGKDISAVGTEVLLELTNTSIGNSWVGGALEKGLKGVVLDNSQLAITGTDFEVIRDTFVESKGLFQNGILNFAGYASTITGCFFVGGTLQSGFVCDGASLQINNCSFLQSGELPVDSYLFKAVRATDVFASGVLGSCISEFDNHKRGWGGANYKLGNVFTRFTATISEQSSAKKLLVGNTSVLPLTTQNRDFEVVGLSRLPHIYGSTLSTFNTWIKAIELSGFATRSNVADSPADTYRNGGIRVYGNDQGETSFGKVELFAKNLGTYSSTEGSTISVELTSIGNKFQPANDNAIKLGDVSNRWSTIYAGTGTINTSDAREKTFSSIPEVEKQVAIELKGLMKRFKFNDAIEVKGIDNARIHYGTSAQEVIAVFEKHGLDAMDYAMICYDKWEDTPEVKDEEGNIVQEYIPAGDRYGIRYEELLCFIISAL